MIRSTTVHRPWWVIACAPIIAIVLFLIGQTSGFAHASLTSSTPAAGALIETSPSEIVATFTEPLDRGYSRLQLFDSRGNEVSGTTLTFLDDGVTMTLVVSEPLGRGTWSVLWRTLSNADGHIRQNYFTFTIGSGNDIAAVVIPGSGSEGAAVPQWIQATSRWSALLGVAALIACWPLWSIVARPAIGPSRQVFIENARRMRPFIRTAFAVALLGSMYALIVQSLTLTDGSQLDRISSTLVHTRYGHLWLTRIGLIVSLWLALEACSLWSTQRRKEAGVSAWLLGVALPIPFALASHASATSVGRTFAIFADATHLYFASLWAGGLAVFAVVLLPGLRGLAHESRRQVLARSIPRFSLLALLAVTAIAFTGLYAAWLQVGNLAALTSTPYGQSLIAKVGAFSLILVLAAINLIVIERRITDPAAAPVWTSRLRWTVVGELALVVLIFLAVGHMTSLQPARDTIAERSNQLAIAFDTDPPSTLLLAPGSAGVNHFRLEVFGAPLPDTTEAILRLTIPASTDLGIRELQLARVAGNAFEHHGDEIGISAEWTFTVILREIGNSPSQAATTVTIGVDPPKVDVPGEPWRFENSGGLAGFVLLLGGCIALVIAIRASATAPRKESGGLGIAAVALGVILLMQARVDPFFVNPTGDPAIDANDLAMVERGEDIYATRCLACHGAELRGDGPDGIGMSPPPADFMSAHALVHSDSDLVFWVRNGKQGTGMPAFGGVLSDQDIRDVLSYIAAQQQASIGMVIVPADPVTCTTAPMTMESLLALVGKGEVARTESMTTVRDGVSDEVAGEIELTVRQLLACTNGMNTWSRLSLFTPAFLATTYAGGVPVDFVESAAASNPLPMEQWLALRSIDDISRLADGRIVATVTIEDPAGQFQFSGGTTTSPGVLQARVIFARQGDAWLIDAVIDP